MDLAEGGMLVRVDPNQMQQVLLLVGLAWPGTVLLAGTRSADEVR